MTEVTRSHSTGSPLRAPPSWAALKDSALRDRGAASAAAPSPGGVFLTPAVAPVTPVARFASPALPVAAPASVITRGDIDTLLALLRRVAAEITAVRRLGNITDAQVQSDLDQSGEVSPDVVVPAVLLE